MAIVEFPMNDLEKIIYQGKSIIEQIDGENDEHIAALWADFKEIAFQVVFELASPFFVFDKLPKSLKVKNGKEKITYHKGKAVVLTSFVLTETPFQRVLLFYHEDRLFSYGYIYGAREDNWVCELRKRTSKPMGLFAFDVIIEGVITNFGNIIVLSETDERVKMYEQIVELREICNEIVDAIGGDDGVGSRKLGPDDPSDSIGEQANEEDKAPIAVLIQDREGEPFIERYHNVIVSGAIQQDENGADLRTFAVGELSEDQLLGHLKFINEMIATKLIEDGVGFEKVKEKLDVTVLEAMTDALVKHSLKKTTNPEMIKSLQGIAGRHD